MSREAVEALDDPEWVLRAAEARWLEERDVERQKRALLEGLAVAFGRRA